MRRARRYGRPLGLPSPFGSRAAAATSSSRRHARAQATQRPVVIDVKHKAAPAGAPKPIPDFLRLPPEERPAQLRQHLIVRAPRARSRRNSARLLRACAAGARGRT